MQNQLPEPIRCEAKRLLKLAQQTNGVISVPSLSAAQEIISKVKGARDSFDALTAKTATAIDEVHLALVVSDLLLNESVQYWAKNEAESGEVIITFYFGTDDFSKFESTSVDVVGAYDYWQPSLHDCGVNINSKHVVGICLRKCDYLPSTEAIFSFAKELFNALRKHGEANVFGYFEEFIVGSTKAYRLA